MKANSQQQREAVFIKNASQGPRRFRPRMIRVVVAATLAVGLVACATPTERPPAVDPNWAANWVA